LLRGMASEFSVECSRTGLNRHLKLCPHTCTTQQQVNQCVDGESHIHNKKNRANRDCRGKTASQMPRMQYLTTITKQDIRVGRWCGRCALTLLLRQPFA
jgi:hypothetical protein